jgi:adhesin transport system membrane fusion protein
MLAKNKSKKGVFRRIPLPDKDLSTDIRTAMLVDSPRGGRYMLWLVMIFFIVCVIWAYFSEVDQVTRGNGKVIPSRQIQVVQNLEGGILEEILVGIGEIVEKGQLLLRIDDTRFSAPYRESRFRYLVLQAKVARLKAETMGTPFELPEDVIQENPEIAERENDLFLSRKKGFEAEISIFNEQMNQRIQELAELYASEEHLKRSYGFLTSELEMTRPLVAQGAVSKVEMLRLEREANRMEGDLEATKLQLPRIKSRLEESKQLIEERKYRYYNEAKQELNDVLSELESISVTSVALEDRVKRTHVRSPVRGTVNQVLLNTVGGIIQPGMDLIEIVPLEDTLLIETKIKPSDIAFLHPGQKAMVMFTAYDFTIYGGLEGQVEHISADSITDETGENFYLVRVRTSKNHLGTDEDPMPIIPGMVTTVDILTGKNTILSYLLKPALRTQQLALKER